MHSESVGPPPSTYAHVAVTLFPLSHSTVLNQIEKFSHFMDSFPCGMLMAICTHLLASDRCTCVGVMYAEIGTKGDGEHIADV
jgi:hypothetical protein